jgi:hypothetical protein
MLHCAGMCGGLAALATGSRRPGRLLAYLAGKTGMYLFLGALAGAAGEVLLKAAPFAAGGRLLAVATGLLLFLAGLDALRLIRLGETAFGLSTLARPLAQLAGEGAAGALIIGAANGLLPCPMTLGFLALAAGSGSPVWGAATLLVLAATSAAPLAACGLLGYRLGRWRGFPAQPIAGALMLAMAVLTIYRGLSLTQFSGHFH